VTFLQKTAAIIGSSLLPSISFAEENNKPGKIRFAYLTDTHVKPDLIAETVWQKPFIMRNR
jgi:hypothetical protein